jgi:hypothetical protein
MSAAELFTVRVWQEVLSGGKTEWRGKIQHVGSGEARYFRDWATMVEFLREILPARRGEPHVGEDEPPRGGRLRAAHKRAK